MGAILAAWLAIPVVPAEVEPPLANPTALWISGIAAAITIIGIGIQWRLWYLAGPRLKVEVGKVMLVADGGQRGAMTVQVVNAGRAATTVRSWHFQEINGTGWIGPGGIKTGGGPPLPHRLDSHEAAFWWLDADEVRAQLLEDDPDKVMRLKARVLYGSRTATSRTFVRLFTKGIEPKESGWRPMVAKIKYRFRQGMWTAYFGVPGDPSIRLGVYSTGWSPLRSVRVSATVSRADRSQMDDAQIATLKAHRYRKALIWKRKPWEVRVPEEVLSLADKFEVWWLIQWRAGFRKHREQKSGCPNHDRAAMAQGAAKRPPSA